MNRKIFLIGLNLYSIFLSLKIRSEFKKDDIFIIEGSKNFLNAYNKLKIKNFSVNPGFHALENIRSKNLLNLLNQVIQFKKIFKTRGLIIGNSLFSYQEIYKNWPRGIVKKYKLKKKNFNLIDRRKFISLNYRYLKYLKNNFSDKKTSFDDSINLSYPWFFPPNYKVNSKDEAAIFNQKIRDKKIKHSYVFPKSGLFENISKGLKKLLKRNSIKIKLNQPLKFIKCQNDIFFDGYKDLNNKENFKIICIPVKPLSLSIVDDKIKKNKLTPIKYFTGLVEVKNFLKSDFDNFTEVITSSEFAFGLKRISLYSDIFNIKSKKIYQIEFLEHLSEPQIERQLKSILILMTKFIKFKNKKKLENMNLIGYSFVRNAFRPKESEINNLTKQTIEFFKTNKNIIFPRQITWPINSNKHFIYANEDYKKIIKKKLNFK